MRLTVFLFLLFSFVEAFSQTTYYSFQSGNLNGVNVWTTDPSGSLLLNSATPAAADNIVVLNGRSITFTQNNITLASVTIQDGATVDVVATTGHNFTSVSGAGILRISSATLPAGNLTSFISANNGTLEFSGAGNYILPASLTTINNLILSGVGTKSLNHNITILNDLTINAGTLTLGNTDALRTLQIDGDWIVNSGGNFRIGAFNRIHTISLYGNFENNGGSVVLHNSALDASPAPQNSDYQTTPTVGAAILEFLGASNANLVANGQTDLNRLIINKGTDPTYVVTASSNNAANFRLFGRNNEANGSTANPYSAENPEIRKALWIRNGTFRIQSAIDIPSVTEGGNDFFIPENGRLWVDGGTIYATTTANGGGNQGFTLYGEVRVSNGLIDSRNSAGIVYREAGTLLVEGGNVRASQLRRSGNSAGNNFTSYIQLGGTVVIDGNGGNSNAVGRFGIDKPEAVFRMEGGILRVSANNGAPDGGLQIDSDPQNILVTGGTVEIVPNGGNFEIGSNAPFYNLDIQAGANNVVLNRQLAVLNDFTIATGRNLDTQNFDFSVGGNFTLNGTYTAGTNTTTINGSENSEIQINHGATQIFNNLTINKADGFNDSLFVSAGQATVFRVDGTYQHLKGVLDYNTFRIESRGNLTLGAQIGQTANTGRVLMAGTTAQTITIPIAVNYAGIGRLEINNSNGVSLTGGNMEVLNQIQLETGVFNINTFNVRAYGGVATSATFSNTLKIQTSGNNSDGGLTLGSYGNGSITYPIGAAGYYTPATVTVSNWQDDGYIQLNPASVELATLSTDPGNALQYYWRVRNSDFTDLPNVVWNFTYDDFFVEGNDNAYVAGKVSGAIRTTDDPAGPTDNVDEATNIITFNDSGNGPFTLEAASYTAAEAARFGGSVTIYYSRALGNTSATFTLNSIPDWNNGNSWTFDSDHDGPAAGSFPGPGDIAIIGYGGSHNPNGGGNRHHIMIEDFNAGIDAQAAEVRVLNEAGKWACILFVRNTSESNIDVIKGGGTIRYLVDPTNQPVINGDFGEFASEELAVIQYYGTGGNATTMITLPSVPTTFPNVRIEGNGNRLFTFPNDIIINRNMIVDGQARFRPTHNVTSLGQIRVGGFNEGIFEFPATTGPVTVEAYGLVDTRTNNTSAIRMEDVAPTPATLTHTFILRGDLTLTTGSMDFYTAGRAMVDVTFTGTANSTLSNARGTNIDFGRITVNKSTPTAEVILQSNITLPTAALAPTLPVTLTQGIIDFDNTNIDVTLTTTGNNLSINSNSGLRVSQGTVRIDGNDTGVLLSGTLAVDGGNFLMGSDGETANDNNFIEYTGSGTATIAVSAGTLTVGSQIRRGFLSSAGALTYNQTGGTVNVGRYEVPNNARGTFEILNIGSSFTHTAGDLFIIREQPNASVSGFIYNPATANATAPIVLGTANTPAAHTIFIDAGQPIGSLIVSNTATNLTASLQINPLTINTALTIQSGNTFTTNGLNVSIGGAFTNDGTFDGTTSTVTFNGIGAQTATINSATTFYDMVVNKSGGTLTIAGSTNPTVTRDLSILNGTLNDGTATISVGRNVTLNATHESSSGRIRLNGASAQTITTNGSGVFGNVEINNANGIILQNALTINGTLTLTNGVFNIDEYLVRFGSSSAIAGTPSATAMIRTDGSSAAGGVRRIFSTGATNFTFPVGVLGKYTPAQYNFASNTTQGTLTVKPVNLTINAASDGGNDLLRYYWNVSAADFTTYSVTHSYTYDQSDVQLAGPTTENDYVPGRFFNGSWSNLTTAQVNTATNVFQFPTVAYLAGDFTAGHPDEFGILAVYYSRNGATGITTDPGADWSDANTWSTLPWNDVNHNTSIPGTPPNGNDVRINTGHFIYMTAPTQNAGSLLLNGTLDIRNTVSHNFGSVSGTGTLEVGYTNTNVPFPAGDFSTFNGPTGGTVRYAPENDLVLPAVTSYNRLEIVSVGNFTRTLPAQNITVYNNIEIIGGARFDPNNRTINLRGNFINSSTNPTPFVTGTSILILDGSAAQTIGGNNPTTFYRLNIQNGNDNNLINNNITITNQLNITSGEVNLNGRVITLGTSATLSEGTGQRIKGTSGYIETTRNLSASPGNVGGMGFEIFYSQQALGNTVLRRYHSQVTENGLSSVFRYYDISPATNTGLNASVRFRYQDEDLNGHDETSLVLYRKPTAGTWSQRGGTPNASTNTVELTGIAAFSEWTVDNGGSLPIELAFIEAITEDKKVTLKWQTATEWENYGFSIERATPSDYTEADTTWREIGFVDGAGTVFLPQDYMFEDTDLGVAGTYFYRLRQMDYDGTEDLIYAQPVNILAPDEFKLGYNFPNPFNPTTTIPYQLSVESQVKIQVYDLVGRLITTLVDDRMAPGRHVVTFDGSRFASGTYLVRMVVQGKAFTNKMILIK